ncbi:MAG: triose-phosphate isomerase [Candidatus Magasanikbacteria bacterium]
MKYIFGNWKMYLNVEESIALAKQLKHEVETHHDFSYAVFPNTLAFGDVADVLADGVLACGAQNITWFPRGAYTGEISAEMFKEEGAEYVLVGHSERRHVFNEDNDQVRKKLEACFDAGMTAVLCIGETKEDRDTDKAIYRIKKQLMKALEGLELSHKELIVAYEPVWAISKAGVGQPCTPADAVDMHTLIKLELKNYISTEIPVLYGGSVNAENINSYISQKNVDGVLVGNASTKADSFLSLIRNALK